MIKAIIWDWNGVLAQKDVPVATKIFAEKYGFDPLEIRRALLSEKETMETSPDFGDYFDKINKFGISKEETREALAKATTTEVFDFAKSLNGKGIKQYLLSDQLRFRSDWWRKNCDLSFFDGIFFSNEIGFVKPNKEAYEFVLKDINLKPEECIFIDDKNCNLEPAKKLGFKTVLFINLENLKKELVQFSIKI
ncbi:MAG: HAD family phosphatase [archaeon]